MTKGDNYDDLCKDVIDTLDPKDSLLKEVVNVLTPHGIVTGEFGMAEAFERKRAEIDAWLQDPREKVKKFASEHCDRLENWVRDEHRRAEETVALRRLGFDEDLNGS